MNISLETDPFVREVVSIFDESWIPDEDEVEGEDISIPNRQVSAPKMVSGYGAYHSDDPTAKVRKPYVGIDLAGIRVLVDRPQSVDKDQAQWMIPSTLPSRTFLKQEREGEYWFLWADLDKDPTPTSEVDVILRKHVIPGYDFELYSSRSAQKDCQKARILIPLVQPLSGLDWVLCQEILSSKLTATGITPDPVAHRTAQLCYLPNRGAFYESRSVRDGKRFDPLSSWADDIAAKRQAIADAEQILQRLAKEAAERREARDMTDSPDTIGAFNHAFTVQDILLQADYAQRGNTFRHPHSESGSYSASVKNGRVHSLSSGDPLYTGGGGGGAHDAFSAFRELWAGGDMKTALKLAGDEWLGIDGESWNKVHQREYMQRRDMGDCAPIQDDPDDAADSPGTPDEQGTPYPPPFRGVMHDVVEAALMASTKPQPSLCVLSALIGMAASCNGVYGLPSGMRLNLFGCGVAGTGEGKEHPRSIATSLTRAAKGKLIGKPASGPGLEDNLTSDTGTLIALDEIAHFFAAINSGKAPPHLIELAGTLLQLFSASRGDYITRVRATAKGILPSRTISHPMVSFLGFATPEKLGQAMGVSNIEDGLLGRFLFAFGQTGVVPRRITHSWQMPESVTSSAHAVGLALPMHDLNAEPIGGDILILIEADAETRLTELLVEFDRQRNSAQSAFAKALLTRSCEKCERVAGVLAVWDAPFKPVITLEHVAWAEQLLHASDDALLRFSGEFMHGGQTQADAQRIVKLIQRTLAGDFKPQKGSEHEMLEKGLAPYSMVMRASKLDKRSFDDATEHLVDLSELEISRFPFPHPNGRPETRRALILRG